MTPEQYQALHDDMAARPLLAGAIAAGDDQAIAAHYNQAADPACLVWRTWVTKEEAFEQALDWSEVAGLNAAEEKIWNWMFQAGGMNPSKLNIRAGMVHALNSAPNTKAALIALSVRPATRYERLFAVGAGTAQEPATMGIEGGLSVTDASIARGNYGQ